MISDISHPNLYIRSLSSRGQLGGLSTFTYDILRLLQFLKFDKIIIETVGSGQSEIDVSKLSDTTIVTLTSILKIDPIKNYMSLTKCSKDK